MKKSNFVPAKSCNLKKDDNFVDILPNKSYNEYNNNYIIIANLNPFRYRGYYYDTETGLYYLNTRYYDPEIGRFINADDVANLDTQNINGLNLYAYCANNPITLIDNSGCSWSSFWHGVGEWFDDHTKELIVGVAFVIAGVVTMGVAAAAAGASIGTILSAMGSTAISSAIQVGTSMMTSSIIGGTISYLNGDGFAEGFKNGLAQGFMWGGVFAGVSQIVGGALSLTRSFNPQFNGSVRGNFKFWSPNSSGNPNIGGTIIKVGKVFRLDSDIINSIHMYIKFGKLTFNHIRIGTILAGLIGGFSA